MRAYTRISPSTITELSTSPSLSPLWICANTTGTKQLMRGGVFQRLLFCMVYPAEDRANQSILPTFFLINTMHVLHSRHVQRHPHLRYVFTQSVYAHTLTPAYGVPAHQPGRRPPSHVLLLSTCEMQLASLWPASLISLLSLVHLLALLLQLISNYSRCLSQPPQHIHEERTNSSHNVAPPHAPTGRHGVAPVVV